MKLSRQISATAAYICAPVSQSSDSVTALSKHEEAQRKDIKEGPAPAASSECQHEFQV